MTVDTLLILHTPLLTHWQNNTLVT